jgi:hypothetical protein
MNTFQKIILSFFILFTFSCEQKNKELSTKIQAPPIVETSNNYNEDTTSDFEGIDTKSLREEYISNYKKIELIDTSFIDKNGDNIHFISKYYCTFDKSLKIPKDYVWEDTSKNFITHNYANDLLVVINNDTVFNKTIHKNEFKNHLENHLKKYAVIMSPKFEYDNKIILRYSLSIPITDLGTSATLTIKKNGKYIITND